MKWLKSRKVWIPVGIMLVVLVGLFYLPWCGITGGNEDLLASVPTSLLMLHLGPPGDDKEVPAAHHQLIYGYTGIEFEQLKEDNVRYTIRRLSWNVTKWPNGIGDYFIVMVFLETSSSTKRISFLCFPPEEFNDVP